MAEEAKQPSKQKAPPAAEEPPAETPEASLKREARRRLLAISISIFLTVVAALLTLAATYWVRPRVADLYAKVQKKPFGFSSNYVARAEMRMKVGSYKPAFRDLQLALGAARDPQAKADAALVMGELLVIRAREKVDPYGVMARQYLRAALDIENRPDKRLRLFRALMHVSKIMNEVSDVSRYAQQAGRLATTGAMKMELLLEHMDAQLQVGDGETLKQLLKAVAPYKEDEKWGNEILLREALVAEQLLRKKEWLDAWVASLPEEERAGAKDRLREDALRQFEALIETDVDELIHEALFRSARLFFENGEYLKARQYLSLFVGREPNIHQRETLLMMTSMARLRGRTKEAQDLMTSFLQRFSWNSVSATEFFAITDEAIAKGRHKESLDIIERYMYAPTAREHLPKLLMKAGRLAVRLALYDKARQHFDELLALDPGVELTVAGLFGQARLCLLQKDYNGATEWLLKYLMKFPYEHHQADAFFMLAEVRRRADPSDASAISASLAAANAAPRDPRAVAALMRAAEQLEGMGLPDFAQAQYNKVALLHYIRTDKLTEKEEIEQSSIIAQATLGNARCLMKMGERIQADHLLRELCNSLPPGSLRSEVAYFWAIIAVENEQRMEALRRLGIVDAQNVRPDIGVRSRIEKMLIEVAIARRPAENVDELLSELDVFLPEERVRFAKRAYEACFDRLVRDGNTKGLQHVFDSAAQSSYASHLPLEDLALKFGTAVLKKDGIDALIQNLQKNSAILEKLGRQDEKGADALIGLVREISQYKKDVDSYL